MTVVRYEMVKVVCVGVVLQRDADGNVVGEIESPPASCYSAAQLVEWFEAGQREVAAANAETNGGPMDEIERTEQEWEEAGPTDPEYADDPGPDGSEQSEAEHGDEPAPMERDDPPVEPTHPTTTPDQGG